MSLKTKIIAICSLVAVTLCLTLAIGFAFSNPRVDITSPVSFNTANGVGASIVASVTNNDETVDINGEDAGTSKTINIAASSATSVYNLSIPEQSFSAMDTTIVYSFTITNTSSRAFKVTESHEASANDEQYTVACNYVNANGSTLNQNEFVTITYTITLLSESADLSYTPNFSFTLA